MTKYNHRKRDFVKAIGLTNKHFERIVELHRKLIEAEVEGDSRLLEVIEKETKGLSQNDRNLLIFFGVSFISDFEKHTIKIPIPPSMLNRPPKFDPMFG